MNPLLVPILSRRRVVLAFAVAVVADGLQWLLGPLGWGFFDEIVDVLALIATSLLIGFHPLLLPTFVIEVVPVADLWPTWIGCVAAVVALRRRQQRARRPVPPRVSTSPPGEVIDL
ncbi:MAG TPA: hypothetical protein VNO52_03505 [Methylomirabilota bacterium]|nr:hypothetical protein [Methylomirabilota bacterium]